MFCKNCGKEILDTAKFCPGCGAGTERTAVPVPAYTPAAEPVPAAPEAPKKKGGSGVVALLIVLCVALVGAGAGLCYAFRDVLFGKDSVDKKTLEAANQHAKKLFTAAKDTQEILSEEGIAIEDGCYLVSESYEKPEEAPEIPESGAVSVSDPEYFYWVLSEEFEELEELEGFGFYVEDEEIVSVIVEEETVIGGYPVAVVPENAEDMELDEEALHIAAGEETETGAEEETAPAYLWQLAPTIEAEDVIVSNLDTTTTYYAQCLSALAHSPHAECAVVLQDGKYGIIGYDGSWIEEPAHDTALLWQSIGCPVIAGNVYVFLGDDALLVEEDSDWQVGSAFRYYMDNATGIVYITDEFGNIVPYNLPYPVRMQTADITVDENNVGTVANTGDLYGAGTQSGELLPCEYEDVHTMLGMEVFAVYNGEGWGYFDAQGEQIVDFVCEGFPRSEIVQDIHIGGEGDVPFIPTEGYIAVKTADGCGYYDISGEEVIPCGTFEDVRPVHGGLAWVKQDGLWGVISFDVTEAPDEEDENSEEGEEPEETEDYTQIALTVLDTWLTARFTCDEELAMSVYPSDYPELQIGNTYLGIEGIESFVIEKFALHEIPAVLLDKWNDVLNVEAMFQIDCYIRMTKTGGTTSGDDCFGLIVKKDGKWYLIFNANRLGSEIVGNMVTYEYLTEGHSTVTTTQTPDGEYITYETIELDDGTELTMEEAIAQGYYVIEEVPASYARKNDDGTFTLLPIAEDGSVVDENGNVLVEAD